MTVNTLRKLCQNDETVSLAKALIKSWKKLLPGMCVGYRYAFYVQVSLFSTGNFVMYRYACFLQVCLLCEACLLSTCMLVMYRYAFYVQVSLLCTGTGMLVFYSYACYVR